MSKLQLTKVQLQTVLQILDQFVPKQHCWVFGSRIKGTADKYSDLDLAVDCGETLSIRQLAQLNNAFDESDLPFTVDLVDWHRIDDDFRQYIAYYAVDIRAALL